MTSETMESVRQKRGPFVGGAMADTLNTMIAEPVRVRCGCCKGTGTVELDPVYAETLALLREQSGPMCGAALAILAGCKNEAMCNRLRTLEEKYGLAKSYRLGRQRMWKGVSR